MIKTRIGEVARARGVETAYQLQRLGFSSSMAARLYRDEVQGIELTTIDKLCEVLQCEPADIFVREVGLPAAAVKN